MFTKEELEKTYQECAKGTDSPELIYFKCPTCRKSFTLTKSGCEPKPCKHLLAVLK